MWPRPTVPRLPSTPPWLQRATFILSCALEILALHLRRALVGPDRLACDAPSRVVPTLVGTARVSPLLLARLPTPPVPASLIVLASMERLLGALALQRCSSGAGER